jgi:hypothetical protein
MLTKILMLFELHVSLANEAQYLNSLQVSQKIRKFDMEVYRVCVTLPLLY